MGFREVDTEEALATTRFTHVRFERSETVPWKIGFYLLNVEAGRVEGWTREGGPTETLEDGVALVYPSAYPSPGNRFLLLQDSAYPLQRYIHDRHTGLTHGWTERMTLSLWGSEIKTLGPGLDEGLLFWDHDYARRGYLVVMDDTLEAVSERWLPLGPNRVPFIIRWAGDGQHLIGQGNPLYTGPGYLQLALFDLSGAGVGIATPTAEWTLPFPDSPATWASLQYHATEEGLAVTDSCSVVHYGLDGSILSQATLGCSHHPSTMSPDGRWIATATPVDPDFRTEVPMAVSVFNAATGEEHLRIYGAILRGGRDFHLTWLADNSGVVVKTPYGNRLVTTEGEWRAGPGLPSPDDVNLFATDCPVAVVNASGHVLASMGGICADWIGWGATSHDLRVKLQRPSREGEPPIPELVPPPMQPVIQRPPFEHAFLVEVVGSTCLNLYERSLHMERSMLTCLPPGTTGVATSFFSNGEVYLRTDEGLAGWADGQHLRWAVDGVLLEE